MENILYNKEGQARQVGCKTVSDLANKERGKRDFVRQYGQGDLAFKRHWDFKQGGCQQIKRKCLCKIKCF